VKPQPDWERVKDLFDRASAIEADARAAWLEQECGPDEAMRQEVASLLAASDSAPGLLDGSALNFMPELLAASPDGLKPGDAIGPYQLEERIGVGGMGTVWRAAHSARPREPVALKLLWQGAETPNILRRFANERKSLASLRHPNIARLLDGGLSAQGRPYLVMEFVEGLALDRYCDERGLSLERRLEILRAVCDSVHFAHRNLIVHRDLKPDNVLVTADGTPKLLDFGISKIIGAEGSESTVTLTEMRAMTPQYASPEQVRGESVTTASDVYSLGVIMYELLTGRRPYRVPAVLGAAAQRVINETDPPRPSTIVLRPPEPEDTKKPETAGAAGISERRGLRPEALSRQLEGDLDKIVMMAMRKDPARRYSSAGHLGEEIRRFLLGQPVDAQDDTFGYRLRKFVRRNRLAVGAGALLLTSLVGGMIGIAWQARLVSEQAQFARSEASVLHRVVELLNYSQREHAAEVARGGSRTLADVFASYAATLRQEMSDEPRDLAALDGAVGETYVALGELGLAEDVLHESLELRRELYPEDHPEMAEAKYRLANLLWLRGDAAAAQILAEEALTVWRQSWGPDHVDLAQVHALLGLIHEQDGELARALQHLPEAARIFGEHFGDAHPRSLQVLEAWARVANRHGDFAAAEDAARRAEVGWRAHRVLQPASLARASLERARALNSLHRPGEARAILEQLRVEHAASLGAGHPLAAEIELLERSLNEAGG
jgi:serine/threonine-protein kinase